MIRSLKNYAKYLLPTTIWPIGLMALLAVFLVTLVATFSSFGIKLADTEGRQTKYSLGSTLSENKNTRLAYANRISDNQPATVNTVKPREVEPQSAVAQPEAKAQSATKTAKEKCRIGEVMVEKGTYAPSNVSLSTRGNKNVGYFHISFMDAYSAKGHQSASGANLVKAHAHEYKKPGTYKPVIYAYLSEEGFRAHQPCDTKIIVFTLKEKPEVVQKNGWQWPAEGKVISVVGMRHQPVTGVYRMHQGIDIANKKGTRINAARNGRVVATNSACRSSASNCGGGYGNYVVLHHNNGLYSIYAHLSKVNVRYGQNVVAGQKVGEMGNTGLTHTVHLHFGIGPTIWVNQNVKDPLKLLPKK